MSAARQWSFAIASLAFKHLPTGVPRIWQSAGGCLRLVADVCDGGGQLQDWFSVKRVAAIRPTIESSGFGFASAPSAGPVAGSPTWCSAQSARHGSRLRATRAPRPAPAAGYAPANSAESRGRVGCVSGSQRSCHIAPTRDAAAQASAQKCVAGAAGRKALFRHWVRITRTPKMGVGRTTPAERHRQAIAEMHFSARRPRRDGATWRRRDQTAISIVDFDSPPLLTSGPVAGQPDGSAYNSARQLSSCHARQSGGLDFIAPASEPPPSTHRLAEKFPRRDRLTVPNQLADRQNAS